MLKISHQKNSKFRDLCVKLQCGFIDSQAVDFNPAQLIKTLLRGNNKAMATARLEFLDSVAKVSPEIQLIFLNHSGPTSNMLAGISSIDFLANRNVTREFINFCLDHPLVRSITIHPRYRRKEIIVEFHDRSELKFNLIHTMIRRALTCLDATSMNKEAFINEFGMYVASHHHHFNYLVLVNQYAQHTIPERYKNYFTAFDSEQRIKIFRYVQPKYDLVLNTLDDLYTPSPGNLLKITVGLRREKGNNLPVMLCRVAEYIMFNVFKFITQRPHHLTPTSKRKNIVHKMKRTAAHIFFL